MKFDFYITGTIGLEYDWWLGQKGTTADQVKTFLAGNKDKELNIAVSSLGGYIDDGIAIGEYIKAHGKCNLYIIGMTASAATVLCMKAQSVRIAKGSMILIHNSSYTLDVWTSANKHGIDKLIADFKKQRDDLDTIDKAIAQIYSCRNGKTIEENMARMDEEKWMLAEDAKDFGLVDEIVDDDLLQSQSKAVKNAWSCNKDISRHFGLPEIETAGEGVKKGNGVKEWLRNLGREILNRAESSEETEKTNQPSENMKQLILNLACALTGIQAFAINEKGEAALTEEQLRKIENELKAKDDLINNLKAEKKTAEDARTKAESDLKTAKDAQTAAETNLQNLQKEFDDFKKEAGDTTLNNPEDEEGKKTFDSAKDLLADIQTLM